MPGETLSFKGKLLDVKISRPTAVFPHGANEPGTVQFTHSGLESQGKDSGRLYLSGYYGMSVSQTDQL